MAEKSDPIRDVVTEARRIQILDAAIEVFAQKGFDKATVKDVAQKAGVADGTIYNYFKSKTDLLTSMIADFAQINQFTSQAAELGKNATPEELIRFIVQNRLALMERYQTRIVAVFPQVINNAALRNLFFTTLFIPAAGKIEKTWQAQIDRGNIRRDIAPEVIVRMMMSVFFGAAIIGYLGDPLISQHTDEFLDHAIDLILNGLLVPQDQTPQEEEVNPL